MQADIYKDIGNGQFKKIAYIFTEGTNWPDGRVIDYASYKELGYIALASHDHTKVQIYKDAGRTRNLVGSAVVAGLIFQHNSVHADILQKVGYIDDTGKVYKGEDNKIVGYVEGIRVGDTETNYVSLVLKAGAALVTLLQDN